MAAGDGQGAAPVTTQEVDQLRDTALGDRFLIHFSEDTLRHRPLGIRLIVEFLGTFFLVTVAAGRGHQPLRRQ